MECLYLFSLPPCAPLALLSRLQLPFPSLPFQTPATQASLFITPSGVRDGPLENLWGGGRSTKKKFAQGKIKIEKNSCTPINPKKYSCKGLKKFHKNLITKKIPAARKFPSPPPHNFSHGPSLRIFFAY